MKTGILLSLLVLCAVARGADEVVLTNLLYGSRTNAASAARLLQQMSKDDLVTLAIKSVEHRSTNSLGPVYVFFRIMQAAQEKGFHAPDAVSIVESPTMPSNVRLAFLDWLSERGIEKLNLDQQMEILGRISPYFTNRNQEIRIREEAHSVCRSLNSSLLNSLRDATVDEAKRKLATKAIQDHLNAMCRVVSDPSENDKAAELFAGHLAYYRLFAREGLFPEATLRSALERALNTPTRGGECKTNIQRFISKQWNQGP